jgi:hypothetical protein
MLASVNGFTLLLVRQLYGGSRFPVKMKKTRAAPDRAASARHLARRLSAAMFRLAVLMLMALMGASMIARALGL